MKGFGSGLERGYQHTALQAMMDLGVAWDKDTNVQPVVVVGSGEVGGAVSCDTLHGYMSLLSVYSSPWGHPEAFLPEVQGEGAEGERGAMAEDPLRADGRGDFCGE